MDCSKHRTLYSHPVRLYGVIAPKPGRRYTISRKYVDPNILVARISCSIQTDDSLRTNHTTAGTVPCSPAKDVRGQTTQYDRR